MWVRDPVRLTCLLIAVIVGAAVCAIPRVTAGLAPFASLVSVQPLDETGGPTPAWALKVQISLYTVALTALVPVMILLAARLGHTPVAVLRRRNGRNRERRNAGRIPRQACSHTAGKPAGP